MSVVIVVCTLRTQFILIYRSLSLFLVPILMYHIVFHFCNFYIFTSHIYVVVFTNCSHSDLGVVSCTATHSMKMLASWLVFYWFFCFIFYTIVYFFEIYTEMIYLFMNSLHLGLADSGSLTADFPADTLDQTHNLPGHFLICYNTISLHYACF